MTVSCAARWRKCCNGLVQNMCWWSILKTVLMKSAWLPIHYVAELKNGTVSEYTLQPEQLGFKRESMQDLVVRGCRFIVTTHYDLPWRVKQTSAHSAPHT